MTSDSANCLMQDNTSILNISSAKNVFIDSVNGACKSVENKINDLDNFESVQHDHDYSCNNNDFKELSYTSQVLSSEN